MHPVCFSFSLPPPFSWRTLYLYRLHLSGKVQGLGYGLENKGAPLMSMGWMCAGAVPGDGVSNEMGVDREERFCLEFAT